MAGHSSINTARAFLSWAVVAAATLVPAPARAAFHLWEIQEIYTNSSGTLQFIELRDSFDFENQLSNLSITATNLAGTQNHVYTIPPNSNPSFFTANHHLLFGTSGIQAAGAPQPDFVIPFLLPDGFLFQEGGTISFFGQNSGPYPALPTDGTLSYDWTTGGTIVNSPTNFAGQTGTIAPVPEPTTLVLAPFAVGLGGLYHWRKRRWASAVAAT